MDDDELNLSPEILARASKFSDRLSVQGERVTGKFTVPILASQGDRFFSNRSGVLLRLGTYHFILTAAHDLREAIESRRVRFYVPPAHSGPAIPLDNCKVLYADPKTHDVAAFHLPPEIVGKVSEALSFLSLHNLDLMPPLHEHDQFLIRGFPRAWAGDSKDVIKGFSRGSVRDGEDVSGHLYPYFSLGTVQYSGPLHEEDLEISNAYFRFQFPIGEDTEREGFETPHPDGMSGCGIWQLYHKRPNLDRTWSEEEIKLIAIQNAFYRKPEPYVKGTAVGAVVGMIVEVYNELKSVLNLAVVTRRT